MKRRDFLASSAAGASYLAAGPVATNAASNTSTTYVNPSNNQSDGSKPEYYELRLYHLRFGKENVVNDFFREVWLPAMKRQGSGPVGVFNVMAGPDSPTLYVLIPYKSLDAISTTARVSRPTPNTRRPGHLSSTYRRLTPHTSEWKAR